MTLEQIQQLVSERKFTAKSHAVRHMVEEGFELSHCEEALLNGRVLEEYPKEHRCLILGTFHWTPTTTDHLHVVVDYSDPNWLDFVTAYIPRSPVWEAPDRRG